MTLMNLRKAWALLSPDHQAQIGEAALIYAVAARGIEQAEHARGEPGSAIDEPEYQRGRIFEAADGISLTAIVELGTNLLSLDTIVHIDLPDLSSFGNQCRNCGCIEDVACPGGCTWVTDDLCSACVCPHGHYHETHDCPMCHK